MTDLPKLSQDCEARRRCVLNVRTHHKRSLCGCRGREHGGLGRLRSRRLTAVCGVADSDADLSNTTALLSSKYINPTNTINVHILVLQPCQQYQYGKQDGSMVLCRMPAVSLPDELREQLNGSESGTINNTRGPGVAVYKSTDGRVRADIYIGLKLDGFKRYENISFVNDSVKFQFALKPVVLCKHDDIDFDPNKDEVIAIKVSRIYFRMDKHCWWLLM